MEIHDVLEPLGFTAHESAVYVELLRGGPGTGYRISKALGRAPAQIYSALEGLARKGAVLEEGLEPRLWRSIEPEVLVRQLEARLRLNSAKAMERLEGVALGEPVREIYRLRTAEQVFARARQVLAEAQSAVVLDCFPKPWRLLEADIVAVAARGLPVAAKVYEPDIRAPDGVRLITPRNADRLMADLGGQMIQCIADGAQYVIAYLHDSGAVRSAFWTGNPLLAGVAQNGLAAELGFTQLVDLLERGAPTEALDAVYPSLEPLLWRNSPGFLELRSGSPETPEGSV
jgi:sugar-specific transcriptional regulator TrmB